MFHWKVPNNRHFALRLQSLLSKLPTLLAFGILLTAAGSSNTSPNTKDIVAQPHAQDRGVHLAQNEEEPIDAPAGVYSFVNFNAADMNAVPEVMVYQDTLAMAAPSDRRWKWYGERLNRYLNLEWRNRHCLLSGQARFQVLVTKTGHIFGSKYARNNNASDLAKAASNFLMTLDGSEFLKLPEGTAVPLIRLNIVFVGVQAQPSATQNAMPKQCP